MELPDDVYEAVKRLCAAGDAASEYAKYAEALALYRRALALLPPPASQWCAATWIFAAIGDTCSLQGDPAQALAAFDAAMEAPDGLGNPFLHLRRGQALFDLGRRDEAANELARAYMLEDEEIFGDEDPKYLQFLRSVLKPSAKNS